jgi:hypothetical protein
MTDVIKFEALEVEVLIGIANEAAEEVESSARKTVEHAERCGRALIAVKEKTPHGKWLAWLGANFDHSQKTASRYMTIASNYSSMTNLTDANDINEALRMIAENQETPKRERKPSVEVIEVEASVPPQQSSRATTEPLVAADTPVEAKPASPPTSVSATVTMTKSSRPPRHLGEHNESEVFALTKADVAITQLNGIPMKNKFRDAALDRVLSWIDSQRTQKRKKPTTSVNQ